MQNLKGLVGSVPQDDTYSLCSKLCELCANPNVTIVPRFLFRIRHYQQDSKKNFFCKLKSFFFCKKCLLFDYIQICDPTHCLQIILYC